MSTGFKPPRRTPSQRGHLERLVQEYGRAHGLAIERTRRWLSIVSFAGALEEGPYGGFSFRRKGAVEDIRDTGSRRLAIQVEFAGSNWQTLQLEVARPEVAEVELVPVAISIADFKLDGPAQVACLSLRYQIAQKLHAVTEQPEGRENLRFWDLIDLILLRELVGEDLATVREACVVTFQTRDMHVWPPELGAPESWAEPYTAAIEEIDRALPPTIDAAADEVRAFIAEIDSARTA